MERWHSIERGEINVTLKVLQELKEECVDSIREILTYGGRINTLKLRRKLINEIDRYIQERYGGVYDK